MYNLNPDSEKLLATLIALLNGEGLLVGADVAISIARIFHIRQISNAKELRRNKNLIVPIIAKNAQEQRRLSQVIDGIVNDAQSSAVEKKEILASVDNELKDKKSWALYISAGIILLSSIVLLVVVAIMKRSETKPKLSISASGLFAKDTILITKLGDSLQQYTVWKFGDSTEVVTNVNETVSHVFQHPGRYQIVVAHHNNGDTVRKEVLIAPEDKCRVLPDFSIVERDESNVYAFQFIDQSVGACIDRVVWDFGDGGDSREEKPGKTTDHIFSVPGEFVITLTIFNTNNEQGISVKQSLVVGKQPDERIDLDTFTTLLQSGKKPTTENGHKVLGLVLLLVTLVCTLIYLWRRVYRKQGQKVIEKTFPVRSVVVAPIELPINASSPVFDIEKKFNEISFRLRQPVLTSVNLLDIQKTIDRSILNAGFPQVEIKQRKLTPDYIFLIEAGDDTQYFTALIENVVSHLKSLQVKYSILFFSKGVNICYGQEFSNGISLDKAAAFFHGSRLVIFSSGYSFLNDYTSTGFVKGIESSLALWQGCALITPIPRNNWGTRERKLLSLLSIFPATLEGYLAMASFFKHRQREILPRTPEPQNPFPVANDIDEIEKALNPRKKPTNLLLTWAFALSLSEEINWDVVIIIGTAVEKFHKVKSGELVNHDNLARLNSLKFIQTGNLSKIFRKKLSLKFEERATNTALQKQIYKDLLESYRKLEPKPGSTAALMRNIKLASLEFKMNGAKGNASIMSHLKQNGLLDSYTSELVGGPQSINLRLKDGVFATIMFLVIVAATAGALLQFGPMKSFATQYIQPDTVSIDSISYYNNRAAILINRGASDREIRSLLAKAIDLDSTNDTARYNSLLFDYAKAKLQYHQGDLKTASKEFTTIAEWRNRLDSIAYPLSRSISISALHSTGVADFYLNDSIGKAFFIDKELENLGYYKQNTLRNNLRQLLGIAPPVSIDGLWDTRSLKGAITIDLQKSQLFFNKQNGTTDFWIVKTTQVTNGVFKVILQAMVAPSIDYRICYFKDIKAKFLSILSLRRYLQFCRGDRAHK